MTSNPANGVELDGRVSSSQPWHAQTESAVEAALRTSPHGLTREEAARRLARLGPNRLEEESPTSELVLVLRQFRSPLIYILLVAAIVTLLLGDYIDSAVIAAALALNALIGFVQERRAEHAVRALMKMVTPRARVIREGRDWEIDSQSVAFGDLVLLESGCRVPADVRLVSTAGLHVDESLLTGESGTVSKHAHPVPVDTPLADRTCMAYMGTVVSIGRGRGVVVGTGHDTEIGGIAQEVRSEVTTETPLQRRMAQFAHIIGAIVVLSALAAFAIGLSTGVGVEDMFLTAVALSVGAIPEGLPVVFTIVLALGVRRMASRNAIIRRLAAAETLGSTTVIGSDKTGTLTQNRIAVEEIWTPFDARSVAALSDTFGGYSALSETSALEMTLATGILTNEAAAYEGDAGDYVVTGDPTEAALLIAGETAGFDVEELRSDHELIAELPFESERQFSASLRRSADSGTYLFVKGAPEKVISMCDRMWTESGLVALDASVVRGATAELAQKGLRVLAMAWRRVLEPEIEAVDLRDPHGLVLTGLQGMMDPPRDGVYEAIASCRRSGIRVIMITGDHPDTALAIARQLEIGSAPDDVLVGRDIDGMDDSGLNNCVADYTVFARVTPDHKLRIVRALQYRGEVVAVTGDGVNDAPALKSADIGVAMGRSGTDVAREAADMVLSDDNFVSIYAAVEEGRVTFDNLRKVTFFLVSCGAAEIVLILSALVLQWPLPLVPAQILWLNLVTNGLQDVALAFEPGEEGVLDRPPRRPREGIISSMLWERTMIAGIVMATGTLVLFRWALDRGLSLEEARTVALTTMVLFQAVHIGNSRSEYLSAFRKSPFSNPFLFISAAAALAVHTVALYLPPTQYVLRVEPLGFEEWALMILVSVTILIAIEVHKVVRHSTAKPDAVSAS